MSNSASQVTTTPVDIDITSEVGKLTLRGSVEPLKSTGALDKYEHFETTGHIGREYAPSVQLSDLLKDDALIRELAIVVSTRGVAFFRQQTITLEEQQVLGDKLGRLSGRPAASGLHVHPTTNINLRGQELPSQVSLIDSGRREFYTKATPKHQQSGFSSTGWHTDITFERVPSDFAILKIHTLPEVGGDTLWGSAYEAYDRLSPAYQKFLEGLKAVHEAQRFHDVARAAGKEAFIGERGNPANVGGDYSAIHPVIRVNPITGWKGLFVNRGFTKRIIGLTKEESERTLSYLFSLYNENHDLQARFRWEKDSVAIWSNTSTVHTATNDYFEQVRSGDRVVSIGEKPAYWEAGVSRRAALGLPAFYQE